MNHVAHQTPAQRVKPGGRFIEEHQLGVIEQRLGQADALEHAFREVTQVFVGMPGQADRFQQFGHTPARYGRVDAVETGMYFEEFSGCQPLLKAEVLRQKADPPATLPITWRSAEHGDRSRAGPDQAKEHLERGRLAGAIWP